MLFLSTLLTLLASQQGLWGVSLTQLQVYSLKISRRDIWQSLVSVSPTPFEQSTLDSSCWEDTHHRDLPCFEMILPSREGSLLLDGFSISVASHLYTWQQCCIRDFQCNRQRTKAWPLQLCQNRNSVPPRVRSRPEPILPILQVTHFSNKDRDLSRYTMCHPGTGCACTELPAGCTHVGSSPAAYPRTGRDPSAGARLQSSCPKIFSKRKLIKFKKKIRKQMSSSPVAAELIMQLQKLLKLHCRTKQ